MGLPHLPLPKAVESSPVYSGIRFKTHGFISFLSTIAGEVRNGSSISGTAFAERQLRERDASRQGWKQRGRTQAAQRAQTQALTQQSGKKRRRVLQGCAGVAVVLALAQQGIIDTGKMQMKALDALDSIETFTTEAGRMATAVREKAASAWEDLQNAEIKKLSCRRDGEVIPTTGEFFDDDGEGLDPYDAFRAEDRLSRHFGCDMRVDEALIKE